MPLPTSLTSPVASLASPSHGTTTLFTSATASPLATASSPLAATHGTNAATHGAASMINRPHRIDPPPEMRAPARRDTWPTANLASSSPSAAAAGHGARFDFATQTVQPDLASPKAVTKSAGDDAEAKREEQLVQDYHMLAQACHRGGRVRGEAFNYFCMGVLLDNLQQYRRAIDSYDKFLTLCQHSKDQQGEMLALNAIGVSYQQMGIEYVAGFFF
jgi:hypothetical protein